MAEKKGSTFILVLAGIVAVAIALWLMLRKGNGILPGGSDFVRVTKHPTDQNLVNLEYFDQFGQKIVRGPISVGLFQGLIDRLLTHGQMTLIQWESAQDQFNNLMEV